MKLYIISWNSDGSSGSTFMLGSSVNNAKDWFRYYDKDSKIFNVQLVINPSNYAARQALNIGKV